MRTKKFEKNFDLVNYLEELNTLLKPLESKLLSNSNLDYPIILIMGPLRSGTTLFLQWLANLNQFAYPTNFLSRFYESPIIGAKIQKLFSDESLNFRNELGDFKLDINYNSQNGKTVGALSPNEFWYFWRKHFPDEALYYNENDAKKNTALNKKFKNELFGIAQEFNQVFALKGFIFNYNIPFLFKLLKNVIFVRMKRDPLTNIESILNARKKQFGNIKEWYSFKIPEYDLLKDLDPISQVSGQVYYLNKALDKGLNLIPKKNVIEIEYEQFCANPGNYYEILKNKLERFNIYLDASYSGTNRFDNTRNHSTDIKIKKAYDKFNS